MKEKYRPINQTSPPTTSLLHVLYSASKNILATFSTIVGPVALELPRPNTTSARRMEWHEQTTKTHCTTQPSSPFPPAHSSLPPDALRSEINVSTTCNVNPQPRTRSSTHRERRRRRPRRGANRGRTAREWRRRSCWGCGTHK